MGMQEKMLCELMINVHRQTHRRAGAHACWASVEQRKAEACDLQEAAAPAGY